jgi:hypothetical protein
MFGALLSMALIGESGGAGGAAAEASPTPRFASTIPPSPSPSACSPIGQAPSVVQIVFQPGTPTSERAAAYAAAGATPGEGQGIAHDDDAIAVTVNVPPGTEAAMITAYRSRPGVRLAMGVVIPPLPCPPEDPAGASAQAQPPWMQPVQVPGSAIVPPGSIVLFEPVPRPQVGSGLRVQNSSMQAATVSYDGQTLAIELPAGFAVRVGRAAELPSPLPCVLVDNQPNVVRCSIRGPTFPRGEFVSFTAESTSAHAASARVTLVAGCTNLALTWPDGTPVATVTAGIDPASALIAIWRLDAAVGRFLGWSPIPGAPSDLTTVNRLDAVFVCMREAGTLMRPAV